MSYTIALVTFSSTQALAPVLEGAQQLAQVILGASHLVQSIIPTLLTPSEAKQRDEIESFKSNLRRQLATQAKLLCHALTKCPGLYVYEPQGAMYAMVKIDFQRFGSIGSDVEFSKKLLEEDNIFVLPGQAFGMDGVIRVVYCASAETLKEASDRIFEFCQRHTAAFT